MKYIQGKWELKMIPKSLILVLYKGKKYCFFY